MKNKLIRCLTLVLSAFVVLTVAFSWFFSNSEFLNFINSNQEKSSILSVMLLNIILFLGIISFHRISNNYTLWIKIEDNLKYLHEFLKELLTGLVGSIGVSVVLCLIYLIVGASDNGLILKIIAGFTTLTTYWVITVAAIIIGLYYNYQKKINTKAKNSINLQ